MVDQLNMFLNLFLEPPSQPRNVRVVDSGPTWAYISWEVPVSLGFPISSAKQYVVTALRRDDQMSRQIPPTPSLRVNATGLLPNSVYEISIVAESVVREATARSSPSGVALTMTTTTGKHLAFKPLILNEGMNFVSPLLKHDHSCLMNWAFWNNYCLIGFFAIVNEAYSHQ